MADSDEVSRSQVRLPGPTRTGATVHVKTPQAKITSQTKATVPSKQTRTKIGVGEPVDLTFSAGTATWTPDPGGVGTLSTTSGATVTFTAPDRANTATITATAAAGGTATIKFTIVEPASVKIKRKTSTLGHHTINTPSVGFIGETFIFPEDVSFENCSYLESEVNAVGTGCFKDYYAANPTGHNPSTTPNPIGPPVNDTSGSKLNGEDQIDGDGTKCAGSWSFAIPVSFQVGSGAAKVFTTVNQVTTITAAGDTTITKGGGHNTSRFGDATEKDPLFP